MLEGGERLRLSLETREAFGIGREELGQHFQRDVTMQPGIARAVHLAHAARAERRDHFVGTESKAGRNRHVRAILSRHAPSRRTSPRRLATFTASVRLVTPSFSKR